jgi:hypothetical protein
MAAQEFNSATRSHPFCWLNPLNWLIFLFRSVKVEGGHLIVKDGFLFWRANRNIRLGNVLDNTAHNTLSWLFGGTLDIAVRGGVHLSKTRASKAGSHISLRGIRDPLKASEALMKLSGYYQQKQESDE